MATHAIYNQEDVFKTVSVRVQEWNKIVIVIVKLKENYSIALYNYQSIENLKHQS